MEKNGDDIYESEITECPDCGAGLEYAQVPGIEIVSPGIAVALVVCSDECGFEAEETWIIDSTQRL